MKGKVKKPKQNTSGMMYIHIFGKSIHLFRLALMGFMFFAIGYVAKGTIETVSIAKNGIIAKGVIIDIRRAGSKGVEDYYYKFKYNGVDYYNSTIYLSKSIGDTVVVIFKKDNPSKNKLEESLLITYGYFLRRNPNLKQK